MAQCITCGTELHPERAQKYNYCMAPECQEKNAKGLTMVAIGMNKAADELETWMTAPPRSSRAANTVISGGARSAPPPRTPRPRPLPALPVPDGRAAPARPRPHRPSPPPAPARRPWTARQERLARIYNEQGLRPDEIADKLGVSVYTATQIVLAARSHTKA